MWYSEMVQFNNTLKWYSEVLSWRHNKKIQWNKALKWYFKIIQSLMNDTMISRIPWNDGVKWYMYTASKCSLKRSPEIYQNSIHLGHGLDYEWQKTETLLNEIKDLDRLGLTVSVWDGCIVWMIEVCDNSRRTPLLRRYTCKVKSSDDTTNHSPALLQTLVAIKAFTRLTSFVDSKQNQYNVDVQCSFCIDFLYRQSMSKLRLG